MSIRFAAIGLNHNHILAMTSQLLDAGATLTWVYASEPDLLASYQGKFPQAQVARTEAEVLDDPSVQLIISASIPDERAPLGVRAMQHGKDYLTDKPGFTTLEQVVEVRRVQAETGRIYSVFFSEHFHERATVKAGELVAAGAIGRVIQTTGLGPHQMGVVPRPAWFYQRARFGGILNDLICHQIEQFLYFTDSHAAQVVAAQVANFNHPQFPEVDDFGDVLVRSAHASGYHRVDWFTPDGLGSWGDGRLVLLGTEGYIELRKNIDIAGRPGGSHLFLVDKQGIQYIDCKEVPLVFGAQLVQDVLNRTETAMPQARCFLASELALQAQLVAQRIG